MREHENRFRRALISKLEARISHLRHVTSSQVLPAETYATNVGRIQEAQKLLHEIPEIARAILEDEEDDGED